MRIRWHGHSCFEVHDGVTLVTDPHDGKSLGIPKPHVHADIILVSHNHFDHNCTRIVKGMDTSVVDKPGKTNKAGVEILGLDTYHDKEEGAKRGGNIVYRFDMGGVSLCHLGDLGHIPDGDTIARLKPLDILFVPVGNVFTIGASEAKKLADMLGTKVIIPMHYRVRGLSLSIKGVDDFLSLFPEDRINRVGNEMDFLQEDLPTDQEVWVFNF